MTIHMVSSTVRELLDIASGFAFVVNANGEIIHTNACFEKHYEEIYGEGFLVHHMDDLMLISSTFKKQFFWNEIFEIVETGKFQMNVCMGESHRVFRCSGGAIHAESDLLYVISLNEVTPSFQMEKKMMEKNGFFESLLNELPQMICAMDDNGNIRYWNQQCTSVLGYSPESLIMKHDAMERLVPSEMYRKEILDKIYRKESGVLRFVNTHMLSFDGTEKTISWTVRYMTNPLVPSLNYWMVGNDVTALEVAMKSLVESEERFSIISKASNDAVWDWDLITGNLWWNEGMTALFGYRAGEIENTYHWWLERVHPSYADKVNEKLERHVAQGIQFWSDEYLFRKADGTYALVFDKGYLVCDEKGKPIRFVGGMVDITHTQRI